MKSGIKIKEPIEYGVGSLFSLSYYIIIIIVNNFKNLKIKTKKTVKYNILIYIKACDD